MANVVQFVSCCWTGRLLQGDSSSRDPRARLFFSSRILKRTIRSRLPVCERIEAKSWNHLGIKREQKVPTNRLTIVILGKFCSKKKKKIVVCVRNRRVLLWFFAEICWNLYKSCSYLPSSVWLPGFHLVVQLESQKPPLSRLEEEDHRSPWKVERPTTGAPNYARKFKSL